MSVLARPLDYLANIRFPTEKAHGIQIMKTCEAFADQGTSVRLIVSSRSSSARADPFSYYGVTTRFPIVRAWSPETLRLGAWGFRLASFAFAISSAFRIRTDSLLYSRDELVLWVVAHLRPHPIVWEAHTGAWNFFARAVARRARVLVVISQGLKDFYSERGIAPGKIVVAHDAVDLDLFAHPAPQGQARAHLGIPQKPKVVMYIGRLDGWKGVETLCRAAEELSPDALVVVVGGEDAQIRELRATYPRVLFCGYRPYTEIALVEAAADVLVLPNTGRDPVSARYTSPLKLFTYMASSKPIVASDLPSLREILSDDSAFFVHSDDPHALAAGIEEALRNTGEASRRARAAREKARQYSWSARAARITAAITDLS